MKRRFIAACAVATAVAALSAAAAGCTRDTAGPGPTAAAAPARQEEAAGDITDADRIVIRHAEQLLVQECMERKGFRYWVAAPPTAEESRSVGYVLDDPGWAAEHGYGSRLEAKAMAARKTDPNLVHREKLSEDRRSRYLAALVGGPDTPELSVRVPGGGTITSSVGGCEAGAKERLYGDRETWFRVDKTVSNLTPLYAADLLRDKRFAGALSKWSRCMSRAGHPYPDPPAAREALPRLTEGLPEKKAFGVEVRLATTDATCAHDTRFGTTARALENEYRDKLRDRYGEELDAHSRIERAALARARQITGSRP
ncbi:hypothetical protein [Streptomyces sp. NPDC006274]|uniref:hypothetical protein n=1 Tax=unclassified Streptomyces TaxID=2593676 RepID=UPI0033AAAA37